MAWLFVLGKASNNLTFAGCSCRGFRLFTAYTLSIIGDSKQKRQLSQTSTKY